MILEHFRENQVLQALHRFGRTEDTEATVFTNHECLPGWIDTTRANVDRYMGSKRRDVIETLAESDKPLLPKEIAERSGVTKRHVTQNVLPDLESKELVGQVSGGHEWQWIRDREGGLSRGRNIPY